MANPVLRLDENVRGRDFVLGDIHGAFSLVLKAMDEVCFDPACDRLLLTGDLIDRGEESARVLRFLRQPYVRSSMGNHEDMLDEMYANGEPSEALVNWMVEKNGLGWWLSVSDEKRQDILEEIRKLPLVIEVATARGMAGIVHADVPVGMDWPTFVAKIEAGCPETRKTALWGRSRIKNNDHSGVAGIGRLFVGHSTQWSGIRRLGNVYAIDSGAIFGLTNHRRGGHLTMANIVMQTGLLIAPKNNESVVDARDARSAHVTPFGSSLR